MAAQIPIPLQTPVAPVIVRLPHRLLLGLRLRLRLRLLLQLHVQYLNQILIFGVEFSFVGFHFRLNLLWDFRVLFLAAHLLQLFQAVVKFPILQSLVRLAAYALMVLFGYAKSKAYSH